MLTLVAVDLYSEFGWRSRWSAWWSLPLTIGYFLLLDRLVRRMPAHRPDGCSIYDRAFWRHERFWKVCADGFPQLFNGTPFKSVIWRMLGCEVGRRVFDDGCSFTERRFVTIGDHCTLNAGSIIQCHSQEDGAFKSDRSSIGAGATLGVGAFVHYGVTVGAGRAAGARLVPDEGLRGAGRLPVGRQPGHGARRPLAFDPLPTPRIDIRRRARRDALAGSR